MSSCYFPIVPQVLEAIFNKRGADWEPQEEKFVSNWLNEPQQKERLLGIALKRLGAREDTEDAWQDFGLQHLINGAVLNAMTPPAVPLDAI